MRERVDALKEKMRSSEQEARDDEIKQINQEKDLHHLEQQLSYYRSQRDKLTVEVAAFADEQSTVKKEIESSKTTFDEASDKKDELERCVNEEQKNEETLRDRVQELMQRRTELNLEVKNAKEKEESIDREMSRLINAVAEAEVGIATRNADIIAANYTIRTWTYTIEAMQDYLSFVIEEIDSLKEKHTEIKSRYDEEAAAVRERELAIRELRKNHDEQVKNLHEIELDFTQKQEKINYLVREIFDRYRVSLDHVYQDHLNTEIQLEESEARVNELKEKVDKIGSVNVDAIHEYDELKVRHEYLQTQHDDLTTSLTDLHKAINKINRTSRVRFQEAFDSVNERFQKLFPKLFEGGKARLVLLEEGDILESGVDIYAQPPGKKLQSVSLLSGGEKALTAVALIFAIFLHRPSPFCLLDEVDAPLDDANIDRFNDLIREMTKLSQFILITHNKRTMELADTLYGVTMEERGASKVISLSLTDRTGREEIVAA